MICLVLAIYIIVGIVYLAWGVCYCLFGIGISYLVWGLQYGVCIWYEVICTECLVWGICHVILGSVWYVVYVMVHSIWGVINADFGLVCLEWCVLWDICIVVGIMYFARGVWYCLFDISMGCLALGVCHGVDIIMCLV